MRTRRAAMRITLLALSIAPVFAIASTPTPGNAPQLPITGTRIVNVSDETALQTAMNNLQAGDTIVIADGTYNLTNTLYVNGKDNVTIRGTSGSSAVVLVGKGEDNSSYGNVPFGVWSNSTNTTVAHLTIRDTWDNCIIFNSGAQSPHVYSVTLLNAGSQFIKANPTDIANGIGVNNGVIEYCHLEYLAAPPADHGAGAGYTNGLSAHAADNWVIRGNLFKNFHTPDSAVYTWNPAVLMWNHSSGTMVEQNTFINVDRAVAFGLQEQASGFDHSGGVIRNNFVLYQSGLFTTARKAGADGAIIVWDSPNSLVYHNTVLGNGNIPFSIEFRFIETTGGEARNNLADCPVNLRGGASAVQSGNLSSAAPAFFVDPANGDLHLLATATAAIDQAPTLAVVTNDIDGDARQLGSGYDIGADEYNPGGPPPNRPPSITSAPTATPNPATAGASVAFAVAATDPDGDTLTYAWDFGDGQSAPGAGVSHTYAAAGSYNVAVSVSDTAGHQVFGSLTLVVNAAGSGGGTGGTGGGTGGTGGSGGTGGGGGGGASAIPMTVSKIRGSASFKKQGVDSCRLSGAIPGVVTLFDPTGQALTLNVSGASVTFTLDKRGRGKSATPNGTIALRFKTKRNKTTKKNEFIGGDVPFTASLSHGAWSTAWSLNPSATLTKTPMPFTITLTLGANTYTATVTTTYSSKAGSRGSFVKK